MEREAARIREQEAELEAALEAAEHALEDTVGHRAELELIGCSLPSWPSPAVAPG